MKFSDLSIEVQQRLNEERSKLSEITINNSYEVLLYNQQGTRFFSARRHQHSWQDNKGNYLPFGGGSEWVIRYGCIGIARIKRVFGYDYELVRGKTYCKSLNGTDIPNLVKTKKEVMNIAKAIGIFNFNMDRKPHKSTQQLKIN